MKLHGNARTCPHSRRLIGRAGDRAGLDARGGGRGRRRERAHGLEVACVAIACEGEDGLLDRSSAPGVGAASDAGGAGRGDRGAASAADDGRRDRRASGDAALDGLGGADPDRAGQAARGWSRPSRRTATSASGRASCCTSTSRSSAGSAGPATASPARPPRGRATARRAARLGVRPRLRRRRDPARLRRGARRREGHDRGRLPPPRRRALPPPTASGSSG